VKREQLKEVHQELDLKLLLQETTELEKILELELPQKAEEILQEFQMKTEEILQE